MTATDSSRAEAERQLAAASARHREAVASMEGLGRPETGERVSIKGLGRAVHLGAITRLGEFTQRMLADLDRDLTADAPSAADLDDLRDRLETAWSAWRRSLGRRET